MLKGQDLVVLAALIADQTSDETYAALGNRTCLSASETHAAVKRLSKATLISTERRPYRRNVIEFLTHGLRYAFPFQTAGGMTKGLATAYAAPIAADAFAATGICPVWAHDAGTAYGQSVEPLYPSAPDAAAKDSELYAKLAIFDMLRGGRIRERQFAERKLMEMLP